MVLFHTGGREVLVLRKRFLKPGSFEGVKVNEAQVYSKEIYADDYCFWKLDDD